VKQLPRDSDGGAPLSQRPYNEYIVQVLCSLKHKRQSQHLSTFVPNEHVDTASGLMNHDHIRHRLNFAYGGRSKRSDRELCNF
jgi:hypothetical protein